MTTRIADIEIPDTKLVAEATELVREVASPLIFDHSRRVYLFGSLRGREQGLRYDPELLYVGAMFHDLGLTPKFRRTDQRFELDGADAARSFLLGHGLPEDTATLVWTGIALHAIPPPSSRTAPDRTRRRRTPSSCSPAGPPRPTTNSICQRLRRPTRTSTEPSAERARPLLGLRRPNCPAEFGGDSPQDTLRTPRSFRGRDRGLATLATPPR